MLFFALPREWFLRQLTDMDAHDFPLKCFTIFFSMSGADFKLPGARQIEQLLTVAIGFFGPKASSGLLVARGFGRLGEQRKEQRQANQNMHRTIVANGMVGLPRPEVLGGLDLVLLPAGSA